jgi:hypothetical protein
MQPVSSKLRLSTRLEDPATICTASQPEYFWRKSSMAMAQLNLLCITTLLPSYYFPH